MRARIPTPSAWTRTTRSSSPSGCALLTMPHAVDDELYARLADRYTDEQIVVLTAFGAIMIATNVFNDALQVPLDSHLEPYRAR